MSIYIYSASSSPVIALVSTRLWIALTVTRTYSATCECVDRRVPKFLHELLHVNKHRRDVQKEDGLLACLLSTTLHIVYIYIYIWVRLLPPSVKECRRRKYFSARREGGARADFTRKKTRIKTRRTRPVANGGGGSRAHSPTELLCHVRAARATRP